MKKAVLLRASCLIWALAIFSADRIAMSQTFSDPNFVVQEFLNASNGISQPIGMTFLGHDPSDFFVIEKGSGRVKRYQDGSPSTVLDLDVANNNERGLLSIALHPNFGVPGAPNNDQVYLNYSLGAGPGDTSTLVENRVSRFTWNGTSLGNEQVLATFGIPTAQEQGNFFHHNGGPIRFGPDGKLYGIIGDFDRDGTEQNNPANPNVSTHVGGVFRLNDDGSIPTDNPFINNPNPDFHRLYAYGIRNSFGMNFDPQTGKLWDTENGLYTYDEINLVEPGFNSGWRTLMGPADRSGLQIPDALVMFEGAHYSDPKFSYGVSVAPTAIAFLKGSAFGPKFDNKVLVGTFDSSAIHLFSLNENRDGFVLDGVLADQVADYFPSADERELPSIGTGFSSLTDLVVGPDGYLYATSLFTSKIYRILPRLLLGDFNRDYRVDELDLPAMLAALTDLEKYRSDIGFTADELLQIADLNGDLAVNNSDIQSLLDLLAGDEEGFLQNVPEPNSLWLASLGTFTIVTFCRRTRICCPTRR